VEFQRAYATGSSANTDKDALRCPPGISAFLNPQQALEVRHTQKWINLWQRHRGLTHELYAQA
jgi:hypothetical protein